MIYFPDFILGQKLEINDFLDRTVILLPLPENTAALLDRDT